MKISIQRAVRRSLPMLLVLLLAQAPWLGCSRSTQVRTESSESSSLDPDVRTQYRHEETRTETEKSSDCSGVLSCGVNVIGEIIAFPFKAVGILVNAIF